MKGTILAAGAGSRLSPWAGVTKKHALSVGSYSVGFHSIARLEQVGISNILGVSCLEHMGADMKPLSCSIDLELDFTYKVSDQAGCLAPVNVRRAWTAAGATTSPRT